MKNSTQVYRWCSVRGGWLAVLVFMLAAVGACASAPRARSAAGGDLAAEAAAFMEAYGRDLRAGDRTAVAARYDRTGAYRMGFGVKEFSTYDAIVTQYATEWSPPAAFEWRNLSYEQVGPDAILVLGQFAWTLSAGTQPLIFSYTGLLRRQDGVLRIRLEDESANPRTLPQPAPRDSTG